MTTKIPYFNTTIPPERTKADIEKLLKEHNVEDIQWTTYQNTTTLRFIWKINVKGVYKEILFQFSPPIIPATKRVWTGTKTERVQVQLVATAYRLLWHYLKNKLEAVRWGLESMEKEFLSHAVVALPNGKEVMVGDQINAVYEMVRSPALVYKPPEGKIVEAEYTEEETRPT